METKSKPSPAFFLCLSTEELHEYTSEMKIYNANSLDDSFSSLESFYYQVLQPEF